MNNTTTYTFQSISKNFGFTTKTVSELTDLLFAQGYRHVRWLSNSEVDYPEYLANLEQQKLHDLENSVSDPYSYPSKHVKNSEAYAPTVPEIY